RERRDREREREVLTPVCLRPCSSRGCRLRSAVSLPHHTAPESSCWNVSQRARITGPSAHIHPLSPSTNTHTHTHTPNWTQTFSKTFNLSCFALSWSCCLSRRTGMSSGAQPMQYANTHRHTHTHTHSHSAPALHARPDAYPHTHA